MQNIETPTKSPETKNQSGKNRVQTDKTDLNQMDLEDCIKKQTSDPGLATTLKRFAQSIEYDEEINKKAKPTEEAEIIYLPQEILEHRAAPNFCLRSALFSVVKKGHRRMFDNQLIASQPGYEVRYSGKQLDQFDLDVWLAVKHLCLKWPLGSEVYFSASEVFSFIGSKYGGKSRERGLKSNGAEMYAKEFQ